MIPLPDTFYKDLIHRLDQGYILLEVLYDDRDQPIDLYYLEANAAADRMAGTKLAGKRMSELERYEPRWLQLFSQIAQTGIAAQQELFAGPAGACYRFHAFKAGTATERKVAVVCLDITGHREKEQALMQSETRYRKLFETMSEGFCVIERIPGEAPDFRWIEGNRAFFQQAGREDLIGRSMRNTFPVDAQDAIGIYETVLVTGEPVRFEYDMPSLGCILELHAFKLQGADEGKVAVLFQDITERKRAENLLMEKEQRQAYLLQLSDALQEEHTAAGIKETACRVLSRRLAATGAMYADQLFKNGTAFYQVTGQYTTGPLLPARLVPAALYRAGALPFDQGAMSVVPDVLLAIPEQEQQAYLQFNVRSFIAMPLMQDGVPVLIFGVYSNKARHWQPQEIELVQETARRTWDAVQRANAEEALKEADRRKDEFLSVLAHELRNPLAAVNNALTVLKPQATAGTDMAQLVSVMDRQVLHLVRLIDDLLDVRRISLGNVELKPELLNLGDLVKDAVEDMLPQFKAHRRELAFTPPPDALMVYGDVTRLTQVLTNLLTNGLRYTGEQGKVGVSIKEENTQAVISVTDNGIGIAREQLASIFDMFIQADHSLARTQSGLGIGLTLVRALVALHQGQVEAFSKGTGTGSTFVIRLPLSQPASKPEPLQVPAVTQSMQDYPVLIIDDNDDGALTLSMVLRKKGFTVYTRPDGHSGIEAASALRPAFIFCDISMPGLDGFETARSIRQQAWGSNMILIALTGYGQRQDKEKAIRAGFDSFLTKPVPPDDLFVSCMHYDLAGMRC